MKHNMTYRHAALLALLSLLLSFGCTKEKGPGNGEGLATIRITEPMLSGYTKALNEGSYESVINTLRVIVAPENPESETDYIANRLFSGEELNNMIIENVPVGNVQIFAFANEASVNKDYSNFSTFLNDINKGEDKLLITDPNREFFPKRGSQTEVDMGLPMSWSDRDVQISAPDASGAPQEIEIALRRCVAKLRIVMNNTLSDPITIKQMSFGPFFADRFFLFWEQNLDVPQETDYGNGQSYGTSIDIEGGGSAELLLYLYPSHARIGTETSPYTIGFKTENTEYPMRHFMEGSNPLSWISRNTQVNIYASLGAEADISIEYYVAKWEEKSVTVPDFN